MYRYKSATGTIPLNPPSATLWASLIKGGLSLITQNLLIVKLCNKILYQIRVKKYSQRSRHCMGYRLFFLYSVKRIWYYIKSEKWLLQIH